MVKRYKQQKTIVKIPKGYTSRERKAISFEVVRFISDRTQRGLDKNDKNFKGYSKSYKESLDFKLAGKTSKVDLTLSEEMLDELKRLKDADGKLEIGYDGRKNKLNGKVEGNIKGTYGQKKPVVSGGRDFLGISKKELSKILKKFPLEEKEKRIQRLLLSEAAARKAKEIAVENERTETESSE